MQEVLSVQVIEEIKEEHARFMDGVQDESKNLWEAIESVLNAIQEVNPQDFYDKVSAAFGIVYEAADSLEYYLKEHREKTRLRVGRSFPMFCLADWVISEEEIEKRIKKIRAINKKFLLKKLFWMRVPDFDSSGKPDGYTETVKRNLDPKKLEETKEFLKEAIWRFDGISLTLDKLCIDMHRLLKKIK